MADNFLQFSETLDALTPEESAWLRHQLEPIAVIDGTEYPEDDDAVRNRDTELSYQGLRFLRDYEDLEDGDNDPTVQGFETEFRTPTFGSVLKRTVMRTAWPTLSRNSSSGSVPINAGQSPTPPPARNSAWASSAAGPCSSRPTRFAGRAATPSWSSSGRPSRPETTTLRSPVDPAFHRRGDPQQSPPLLWTLRSAAGDPSRCKSRRIISHNL